jgi:hypothetical protein
MWSSLSEGNIGAGYQFTTTQMSVGFHWITLATPDGLGGVASKSLGLTVGAKIPATGTGKLRHIPKYRLKGGLCDCIHVE